MSLWDRRISTSCRLLGLLLFSAVAGCSSFDLANALPWSSSTPKPEIPSRMIDLWTFTALTQEGLAPIRGFGGRVMFYNDKDEKPLLVDGAFTVFAFDETTGEITYSSPDKKYVFTPEQLSKHYSKSELGHSYSFWLPWDEVGGPERKVCLIARFQPKGGPLVIAKPCHQVLAGEPPKTAGRDKRHGNETTGQPMPSAVQQVAHQMPLDENRHQSEAMITIDVPPSFMRPPSPSPSLPEASAALGSQGGDSANHQSRANADPRESEANKEAARRASVPSASLADRFARWKSQAQKGPVVPPRSDPIRRQPLPAGLPSALPPTPRSDSPGGSPGTPASAGSTPN